MGLSCTEIPDFATVFNNVYNAIGSDNFTKFLGKIPQWQLELPTGKVPLCGKELKTQWISGPDS